MGDDLGIPMHLAVHVSGFAVAAGLAAHAGARRDELGPGWLSLVVGASLLALSSVVLGAELAEDEGHGFRKQANREFQFLTTIRFLRKHLLDKE